MSDQRARIWVGPSAPSDPLKKPLDTECCFWFDTTANKWKRLTAKIPTHTWTEIPGGSSGSTAWNDITGKPATFAPTIGSTSTTAVAGNDSRLTDARTPTAHTHAIADTTGLQAALDAKSATSHNHTLTSLSEKSYNSLTDKPTLGTAAPLNVAASGNAASTEVVKGNDTRLADSRTPTTHGNEAHSSTFITQAAITTHEAAADPHTGYQKESEKGAASGYASLDAGTKVPIAELPTGTTSTTVALGDHTHAQLHARQHSITDTADHTFPGGTSNFLRSDGTFAAPTASIAAPFKGNYATGSFTIETAKFGLQGRQLALVSTDRATLEGTSRLIIHG